MIIQQSNIDRDLYGEEQGERIHQDIKNFIKRFKNEIT